MPAQLAEEIERMLDDPELRRSMGESGHAKALEYDGDRLWQRNMEVFRDGRRRKR